jgi:hypothetical protein
VLCVFSHLVIYCANLKKQGHNVYSFVCLLFSVDSHSPHQHVFSIILMFYFYYIFFMWQHFFFFFEVCIFIYGSHLFNLLLCVPYNNLVST